MAGKRDKRDRLRFLRTKLLWKAGRVVCDSYGTVQLK